MKAKSAAIVSMAILCFSFGLPAHAEFRIWEDNDGNLVEAELVASFGKKAVLIKKQDGQVMMVETSRLSKTDQKYIKKWKSTPTPDNSKTGENYYYVTRFRFRCWTDWASVTILPPWNTKYRVIDTTIVEPTERRSSFRVSTFGINKESDFWCHKVEVVYTVLLKSTCPHDLELEIGKGSSGDAELVIHGYDTNKKKFKRLRSFHNSTRSIGGNEELYKLPLKTIRKLGCVELNRSR